MDRKRILIVTPSLPFPANWGFAIRVYQMVRHLAMRNDVTVLSFARGFETDAAKELASDTGARVVTVPFPYPDSPRRTAQLLSLASPHSFLTQSLTSAAMQAQLTALLKETPFDIVQVESSQLGGYDYGSSTNLVLDEHNIEYELLQRMYQTEKSLVRRIYNYCEFIKLRKEERRFWDRAAGIVMTSEREAVVVRGERPGKPVTVAPNGVDIDFFKPANAKVDPNSVVFTGLMRYRPNIDAALFFVNDVLPRILQRRPDTVVSIVGMGPPAEVEALASPNVVVTGAVPDVRPYVDTAAVCAVPLRMGSGTRLKVLEGLSMGKAMISTSVGCEGIDVEHGRHLLIADEATEFADQLVRLLEDQELRASLGEGGRALAVDHYGWASVVDGLELFYDRVLASRGDGRAAVTA